ncbi:MAG: 2-oxoglutarate dehydrogenase E1 component, partial [Arenimonas sp.]
YEGQGPEHSSARLERLLQLSAEQNGQVCVPSTPAQMFHLLRRQMLRALRKPLIVLTPKSLLRHKQSSSTMQDLAGGHFHAVIDETDAISPEGVERLVFCSGKVYYDLLDRRRADELARVAILRIEQLYPFPAEEYEAALGRYSGALEIVWCQEEPQNQGAWYQIQHHLNACLSTGQSLSYAGRARSAAPACGHSNTHVAELTRLIEDALINPPVTQTAE